VISADAIAAARAVHIDEEIARRGIRLRGTIERSGPCPVCGGRDRFSINIRKQVFNCRGCVKGGGVIDLVMLIDGCGFREAVEALAGERTERPQIVRERHQAREPDDAERINLLRADRTWNETIEIVRPAINWLAARGISLDGVPERAGLRWHPACPWGVGTAPCIVARFTDALTNEPRGLWRRPITGEKPKTLGPMAGGVIRLWPDDDVEQGLVLGEGVETTLAAATRIQHNGTLLQPAWATGGSGNVARFPVLPGVEALTLLVDNDENGAGQQAAEKCARRWLATGREVELLTPNRLNDDFNDLVVARSGTQP